MFLTLTHLHSPRPLQCEQVSLEPTTATASLHISGFSDKQSSWTILAKLQPQHFDKKYMTIKEAAFQTFIQFNQGSTASFNIISSHWSLTDHADPTIMEPSEHKPSTFISIDSVVHREVVETGSTRGNCELSWRRIVPAVKSVCVKGHELEKGFSTTWYMFLKQVWNCFKFCLRISNVRVHLVKRNGDVAVHWRIPSMHVGSKPYWICK